MIWKFWGDSIRRDSFSKGNTNPKKNKWALFNDSLINNTVFIINMWKEHINRILVWSRPTILIICTIIGVIAILFYPFFNGKTIYDFFEGPSIKIESIYPPSDSGIEVNYFNDGGPSLNNIEIRYALSWDKSIIPDAPSQEVSAVVKRSLINRGDYGTFFINFTNVSNFGPTCKLAKEYPRVSKYWSGDLKCFYRWETSLPEDVCLPAQIDIIFASKEIPEYRQRIYYPLSEKTFHMKFGTPANIYSTCNPVCKSNIAQECLPYDSAENKEALISTGTAELESMKNIINDTSKLSKNCVRKILCQLNGVLIII